MRLFVITVIFLLIGGFVFAQDSIPSLPSDSEEMGIGTGGPASADVTDYVNRKDSVRERAEAVRARARENVKTIAESRNVTTREAARDLNERFKSRCEAVGNETIRRRCTIEIDKLRECRNVTADNETECKKNLVASAALHMVRERQNLSEQCRNLTGENRGTCQRRINTIFKNETHARFLAFVKARKNGTLEELNETDMVDIKEKYRNRTTKIKEKLNESKEKLFVRLEHAIDARENRTARMQQFIDKANASGHDTLSLEFLLGEYRAAIASARAYVEAEHYRDAIGALQESERIFVQFKQSAANLIKKHKEGLNYEVDEEKEFVEEEELEDDG